MKNFSLRENRPCVVSYTRKNWYVQIKNLENVIKILTKTVDLFKCCANIYIISACINVFIKCSIHPLKQYLRAHKKTDKHDLQFGTAVLVWKIFLFSVRCMYLCRVNIVCGAATLSLPCLNPVSRSGTTLLSLQNAFNR